MAKPITHKNAKAQSKNRASMMKFMMNILSGHILAVFLRAAMIAAAMYIYYPAFFTATLVVGSILVTELALMITRSLGQWWYSSKSMSPNPQVSTIFDGQVKDVPALEKKIKEAFKSIPKGEMTAEQVEALIRLATPKAKLLSKETYKLLAENLLAISTTEKSRIELKHFVQGLDLFTAVDAQSYGFINSFVAESAALATPKEIKSTVEDTTNQENIRLVTACAKSNSFRQAVLNSLSLTGISTASEKDAFCQVLTIFAPEFYYSEAKDWASVSAYMVHGVVRNDNVVKGKQLITDVLSKNFVSLKTKVSGGQPLYEKMLFGNPLLSIQILNNTMMHPLAIYDDLTAPYSFKKALETLLNIDIALLQERDDAGRNLLQNLFQTSNQSFINQWMSIPAGQENSFESFLGLLENYGFNFNSTDYQSRSVMRTIRDFYTNAWPSTTIPVNLANLMIARGADFTLVEKDAGIDFNHNPAVGAQPVVDFTQFDRDVFGLNANLSQSLSSNSLALKLFLQRALNTSDIAEVTSVLKHKDRHTDNGLAKPASPSLQDIVHRYIASIPAGEASSSQIAIVKLLLEDYRVDFHVAAKLLFERQGASLDAFNLDGLLRRNGYLGPNQTVSFSAGSATSMNTLLKNGPQPFMTKRGEFIRIANARRKLIIDNTHDQNAHSTVVETAAKAHYSVVRREYATAFNAVENGLSGVNKILPKIRSKLIDRILEEEANKNPFQRLTLSATERQAYIRNNAADHWTVYNVLQRFSDMSNPLHASLHALNKAGSFYVSSVNDFGETNVRLGHADENLFINIEGMDAASAAALPSAAEQLCYYYLFCMDETKVEPNSDLDLFLAIKTIWTEGNASNNLQEHEKHRNFPSCLSGHNSRLTDVAGKAIDPQFKMGDSLDAHVELTVIQRVVRIFEDIKNGSGTAEQKLEASREKLLLLSELIINQGAIEALDDKKDIWSSTDSDDEMLRNRRELFYTAFCKNTLTQNNNALPFEARGEEDSVLKRTLDRLKQRLEEAGFDEAVQNSEHVKDLLRIKMLELGGAKLYNDIYDSYGRDVAQHSGNDFRPR